MNQKPFLNEVTYKSDNVITFLSGGINNVYPSQFIADDEVQDMYNMSIDSYPTLRTRCGRTLFKKPGVSGQKIEYFGVAGLNYLFYIQNGTLKDIDGSAIATGLTGSNYSHVYYKDGNNEYLILYGDNCEPTRHILPLSSFNTPEIVPLPEEEGEKIHFEHMCYHKGRMFGSNGDMLYLSALQNPMDYTTAQDSGYIKVTNATGKITALVSFDDKLVIFSQNNMHILYGDTVSSESGTNFNLVDLNNGIGAYDQNALKVHKGYLYWIYATNIYEYDGSTIRSIEKPSGNNGMTGGIQKYIEGILYTDAQKVSIAGSDTKVYFYFPNDKGRILIFDQRLRKWTQEFQSNITDELYYVRIADSFNSINFSQTPEPVYALTSNGIVYELTGGRRDGNEYIKLYGEDEYPDSEGITRKKEIEYYLKTKEFTENGVSKKKCLKEIWVSYDLEGTANFKITTNNGKEVIIDEALTEGSNKVECILVPYTLENVDNYTIEIYGSGDLTIKQIERKYRIKRR